MGGGVRRARLTLNDLADTNLGDEVTTADGAVEPYGEEKVSILGRTPDGENIGSLFSLVIGLRRVLEEASVLDGHGLAGRGLGAFTLLSMFHSNGHVDLDYMFMSKRKTISKRDGAIK